MFQIFKILSKNSLTQYLLFFLKRPFLVVIDFFIADTGFTFSKVGDALISFLAFLVFASSPSNLLLGLLLSLLVFLLYDLIRMVITNSLPYI